MNLEKHASFHELSKSNIEGLPRSHKATKNVDLAELQHLIIEEKILHEIGHSKYKIRISKDLKEPLGKSQSFSQRLFFYVLFQSSKGYCSIQLPNFPRKKYLNTLVEVSVATLLLLRIILQPIE